MIKRVRSRVQTAEMSFLQKVRDLSLLDKVKSIDICQSRNIEPLLLCIERSQLRWYGRVTRMSHEQTAKQIMDAFPGSKRPRGQKRTRWRNYAEDLAWSRLGIPPAESPLVAKDQDAWRSQIELLQKDKRVTGKKNTPN